MFTEPKIFERPLYITRRFAKNSSKNVPFWVYFFSKQHSFKEKPHFSNKKTPAHHIAGDYRILQGRDDYKTMFVDYSASTSAGVSPETATIFSVESPMALRAFAISQAFFHSPRVSPSWRARISVLARIIS
jgi:hypothetical protein